MRAGATIPCRRHSSASVRLQQADLSRQWLWASGGVSWQGSQQYSACCKKALARVAAGKWAGSPEPGPPLGLMRPYSGGSLYFLCGWQSPSLFWPSSHLSWQGLRGPGSAKLGM